MADHGCINGSLDGVDYSSPLPVVGLYIAAASAVCTLMMVWDIKHGIFAKKNWIPCKAFKLDSVTLILLGVAAKLPLDLTSEMPSPKDQLSKLTGVCIICISIGFFAPYLGVSDESESFTNLVALSIFVITVAANICIQLHTGVIVLFYTEHIIIMCVMFVLLMLLWHTSLVTGSYKKITADQCKALLEKGNNSLLRRLKVSYLYSYCSNPQFIISKNPIYAAISIGSLWCSVILMQAAFRSVILNNVKFCSGDSKYGWSVPYILGSQILTVVVGTLAIMFRWLSLFQRMKFEKMIIPFMTEEDVLQRILSLDKWYGLRTIVMSSFMIMSTTIQLVIVAPSVLARKLFGLYRTDKLEYFDQENVIAASGYIVRRSVSDMMKLMSTCKKDSLRNLSSLLSESGTSGNNSYSAYLGRKKIDVSCLSVVLLVKIAQASIPDEHLGLIPSVFHEVKEILHFIEETLQRESSVTKNKFSYARALWTRGNFNSLLSAEEISGEEHQFDRAVSRIEEMKAELKSDSLVGDEVRLMVEFIDPKSRQTVQGLSSCMKQMFIDLVHELFSQLPAIYTSLIESPSEEFKGRVKLAMNCLFQIEFTRPLEDQINWAFPSTDIVSMITDDTGYSISSIDPLEIFHELISRSHEQEPIHGVESV